jgi:hypothetical protein
VLEGSLVLDLRCQERVEVVQLRLLLLVALGVLMLVTDIEEVLLLILVRVVHCFEFELLRYWCYWLCYRCFWCYALVGFLTLV